MTDRIDELSSRLERPSPEGPSSDAYNVRVLNSIVSEIEAKNAEIINVEPNDILVSTPVLSSKELSTEAYGPQLMNIGKRSSSGPHGSETQKAGRSLNLSALETPSSSTGNKIAEFRAKSIAQKKKRLALAA